MEAAFRCLAAKGSASVSLRDIAREAGVALSQIHYYFGGKEGLLTAAAAHVIRRHLSELRADLAQALTPAQQIKQVLRFIRGRFLTDATRHKVYLDLLSMAAWSPKLAEMTRPLQEELVVTTLSVGEQTGGSWFASKAAARVVLAALDGLALQALQGAAPEEINEAYKSLEELLLLQLR